MEDIKKNGIEIYTFFVLFFWSMALGPLVVCDTLKRTLKINPHPQKKM